jgi:TRAP-type C4-dicarboxylate transport system substrate-binding protein
MMKRSSALIAAAVFVPFLGTSGAVAQEVTLTVHHFASPKAPTQVTLIEPWAQRIEEQSDGRIKVEIFPSMAMGGAPPELYRQVRDGAADLVWTLIGYTPGVFPRVEAFELPSVHGGSARATALAIQDTFDLIAEDFKDVKPILVYAHAGNALHTVSKEVASPDDLAGMKLRTPSRSGAWLIEALGAEPVGMPVPDVPQALAKGAVDGVLLPFEIMPALNAHELVEHSYEGPNGERLGTSVFLFAMNKERYEALPDDLKKVIDDNSGAAIADWIGTDWDKVEESGKVPRGGSEPVEVTRLSPEEWAAFSERAQAVTERWIEEANANGIDGAALVEAASAAVKKHSE